MLVKGLGFIMRIYYFTMQKFMKILIKFIWLKPFNQDMQRAG